MISNLLGNAIKFTSNQEEGGSVSVTLEENHNNLEEVIVNIRVPEKVYIKKYYQDYLQSLLPNLLQALG